MFQVLISHWLKGSEFQAWRGRNKLATENKKARNKERARPEEEVASPSSVVTAEFLYRDFRSQERKSRFPEQRRASRLWRIVGPGRGPRGAPWTDATEREGGGSPCQNDVTYERTRRFSQDVPTDRMNYDTSSQTLLLWYRVWTMTKRLGFQPQPQHFSSMRRQIALNSSASSLAKLTKFDILYAEDASRFWSPWVFYTENYCCCGYAHSGCGGCFMAEHPCTEGIRMVESILLWTLN